MGTLTSQPYAVEEGKEYVDYLDRILGECRRLLDEKRLPDGDAVIGFLDDAELVARRVRFDTSSAQTRGALHTQTAVAVSLDEYKRILTMSESLLNLLEILEIRQAVTLNRTPAVAKVAQAFREGTFAD